MRKDVVTSENIYNGMRVKRGPDWQYSNQDFDSDGFPRIGTVTNILSHCDGWADVKWDGDISTYNYRFRDAHDLIWIKSTNEILDELDRLVEAKINKQNNDKT